MRRRLGRTRVLVVVRSHATHGQPSASHRGQVRAGLHRVSVLSGLDCAKARGFQPMIILTYSIELTSQRSNTPPVDSRRHSLLAHDDP